MNFSNQTVVIVGGSSGIGFATAKAAHAQGASVILVGRSFDRLQQASAAIGSQVREVQTDIEDESSVEAAFGKIGRFNHLFISAQDATTSSLAETTKDKLRPTLDSKIWGALHTIKHAVRQMLNDN